MDLYKLVYDLNEINDININILMVKEYVLSLADKDGYIDRRSLRNAIFFFEMNNIINYSMEQLIYNYLQYHSIKIIDKVQNDKKQNINKDNISRVRKG